MRDARFAACAVQGNLRTQLIDEIPRITTSPLVQAFLHGPDKFNAAVRLASLGAAPTS
jgi:hypothetical protein